MRRIKLKKNKKIIKFKFLFLLILFFFIIISIIKTVNKKINPILIEYSEIKIKNIVNSVINDSVNKNLSDEEFYKLNKNTSNIVNSIDLNSASINKILSNIANTIYDNLILIENGDIETLNKFSLLDEKDIKNGIVFNIPLGVIFDNNSFFNFGPEIPVKIKLIGNINSYINTKVTNYGINNALVELSVNLEVKEQIILPFLNKPILIKNSIPISLRLIEGKVPNYYLNGINKNSAIITPD